MSSLESKLHSCWAMITSNTIMCGQVYSLRESLKSFKKTRRLGNYPSCTRKTEHQSGGEAATSKQTMEKERRNLQHKNIRTHTAMSLSHPNINTHTPTPTYTHMHTHTQPCTNNHAHAPRRTNLTACNSVAEIFPSELRFNKPFY